MVTEIFVLYALLTTLENALELWLAITNRRYVTNASHQVHAQNVLGINADNMKKAIQYSGDKYKFGILQTIVSLLVNLTFIGMGGLGLLEGMAKALSLTWGTGEVVTGLVFFALFSVLGSVYSLPWELYSTFKIEGTYGFNRQTLGGFFVDKIKGTLLTVVLGGPLLAALMRIMSALGENWWLYAWMTLSGFSLLTMWLYPSFLAPLFNKFSPLPEGDLKSAIIRLSEKVGFRTGGLFIMDASKRSTHANAFFTGLFREKRIVLFDTLVDALSAKEVVAVLAHELGHFKLNHVRWMLIRSIAMTGLFFYVLGLVKDLDVFYRAFSLDGVSSYGALIVFGYWYSTADFFLKPIGSYLSRSNEFAADAFAKNHIEDIQDLGHALLKLREKSQSLPLAHPLFSRVYYSHPPLLERLQAMGFKPGR